MGSNEPSKFRDLGLGWDFSPSVEFFSIITEINLKGEEALVYMEKLTPPTRPVGKPDGLVQGSSHSNLTTPNFNGPNGQTNWSKGEPKDKIFKK